MSIRLAGVGHDAAMFAVTRWHYSRTMPVPPVVKYGVWEDGAFIGVLLFSRGAASNLGRPYGLTGIQVCELTRVALRSHTAPVSAVVALGLKRIHADNPGLRLVVSFADPARGHVGTIYQAGSWTYTGTSAATQTYTDDIGRIYHSRQISPTGVNTQFGQRRRVLRPDQLHKVEMPGKHRYLMPLDKAMRRKIMALALPYPHAVEVSVETHSPSGRESRVRSPATARKD
jgi:hypothetical protein